MQAWLQVVESKFGDATPASRLAPFLLDLAEQRTEPYLDLTKSKALCPDLEFGAVSQELLSTYLVGLGIPVSDA